MDLNTGITDPRLFGFPRINPSTSYFNYMGGNSSWPLATTPSHTENYSDTVSYKSANMRSVSEEISVTVEWTTTVPAMAAAGSTSIISPTFSLAMCGLGIFSLEILAATST